MNICMSMNTVNEGPPLVFTLLPPPTSHGRVPPPEQPPRGSPLGEGGCEYSILICNSLPF